MKFVPVHEMEKENYKLLSGAIVPRPIAWITTLQENGKVNAAPFSYFNIVSSQPPMLSVSVRYDTDKQKDTSRNIFRTNEFVVHIISEEHIVAANKTSKPLLETESEVAYANLDLVQSTMIDTPGLKQSKIRFECKYETHLHFETTDLIIGRVVGVHVEEDLWDNNKIDIDKLRPVSRLSGSRYGLIGKVIPLPKEK